MGINARSKFSQLLDLRNRLGGGISQPVRLVGIGWADQPSHPAVHQQLNDPPPAIQRERALLASRADTCAGLGVYMFLTKGNNRSAGGGEYAAGLVKPASPANSYQPNRAFIVRLRIDFAQVGFYFSIGRFTY